MPERAAEIRRAHLVDVVQALLKYVEAGHKISLMTAHLGTTPGGSRLPSISPSSIPCCRT